MLIYIQHQADSFEFELGGKLRMFFVHRHLINGATITPLVSVRIH
jgi:hypothetical protein